MQAVILAAGMGKRLKQLTDNNTKCMVKVNGISLIDRMLNQIDRNNLNRIIIVVGYKAQVLIDYIKTLQIETPIIFVENQIYDKTNNIYSLLLAKDYLQEDDTLLFESDLIFEDSVIQLLLDDKRDSLALVDKYESWMDGTCIKIDENDFIKEFVPGTHFKYEDAKDYYKTVNIYKFSKDFSNNKYIPFLEAYIKALGENEYYEQVLRVISNLDNPSIYAKKLSGQIWYEIDDVQDLDIAESLFTNDIHEKFRKISTRYGGYWRYPKLMDFSNPYNPYFPPQRMKDEIKASADNLLNYYPSGKSVIKLLASKIWGIKSNYILVTAGIESCIEFFSHQNANVGVIFPTRKNVIQKFNKNLIPMKITTEDFSYTADEVIDYYSNNEKKINYLIIYNPGYHTGFYLNKNEVEKLCDWTNKENIKLIYDESTIDFLDEEASLINNTIIEKYNNLIILKDMSVSHGIIGLRLASLITSNTLILEELEKNMPCWNIDSFSEFYLQIIEKYQKIYKQSLVKLSETRISFYDKIKNINGIKVISTTANYILCELINGKKSQNVCEQLLESCNILARNLTNNFNIPEREFVKFAIRSDAENDILCNELNKILK